MNIVVPISSLICSPETHFPSQHPNSVSLFVREKGGECFHFICLYRRLQWLGEEVHVRVVCIRSFLSYLDSATVLYFSTITYWQCRFMFVLGGVISIFSYIYSATVLYFQTTTYRHCSTMQCYCIRHIRRGVVLSGP